MSTTEEQRRDWRIWRDRFDAALEAIEELEATGPNYALWQSAEAFNRAMRRALRAMRDASIAK